MLESLPVKQIIQGDCAEVLQTFPNDCIDLTVTSPPYDNLREYKGYAFDFETIAQELYRVTKPGGVLVWVVGNQVIDGDETDTAERQIIKFKEIGWHKHQTIIFEKAPRYAHPNRYSHSWEFMPILSKGEPRTVNLLKDIPTKNWSQQRKAGNREPDGSIRRKPFQQNRYMVRPTIWYYPVGWMSTTNDTIAFEHPAIFPDALAEDHIKSWSNEDDIVLDCFAGSGTTLKAAEKLRRKWIGIEISPHYIEIANKRLAPLVNNSRLTPFLETEQNR